MDYSIRSKYDLNKDPSFHDQALHLSCKEMMNLKSPITVLGSKERVNRGDPPAPLACHSWLFNYTLIDRPHAVVTQLLMYFTSSLQFLIIG